MSWSTSVLVGVLWITTSALFSTYANGQFLRRFHDPFAHTFVRFALSSLLGLMFSITTAQPLGPRMPVLSQRLMVPSVLLLVANLLNSMSMLCSGVTLTYVVKSLIPFFTVISCRLRGQRFETSIYLSLVPVCLGVSLASATDVECSLEGILCALGSSLAQTWLNITSKEKIQTLKLSGMEAFTVMATVCAGLSIPLLAVSYAKDKGDGIVTACLSLSQKPCYTSFKVIAMAAFAYHVEYTLNFLFVALCNPLAFSVTDIVRRLGTICCGAVLFNKPMTLTNGSGVVISLLGVCTYTLVSREWANHYSAVGKKEEKIEIARQEPEKAEDPRWWMASDSSMGISPEVLCALRVWPHPRRKRFGRFHSDTGLTQRHDGAPALDAGQQLRDFRRCISEAAERGEPLTEDK
ncbi:unnamed protein product [Effrenium voratum]|nr:unnamed protein product [Effrenium voratum]CAJ1459242.1 unnamed protein product [Effrenium voratum]